MAADMATDPTAELNDVLAQYDLGELVRFERDRRGTVNVSYYVETRQGTQRHEYFLRAYKRGIKRDEILFEHSLINHIVARGGCPVARLHRARNGSTFYRRPESAEDPEERFYAIFDFLHGEDRYTWVGPVCSHVELSNAGTLLAEFHKAGSSLQPEGQRAEPKILDLLELIADAWAKSPSNSKGTRFDRFLFEHFDLVGRSIAETRSALHEPTVATLPQVIIHSDYHPGNLVFAGDEICGLVDFDWSKVDLRAFDVALAVWYFCASWDGDKDGHLRLADASTFLTAYQGRLLARPGLSALTVDEFAYLPHLINAGNIYILYWTLRDYFGKDVDPQEYLIFLMHGVAFARWFGDPSQRQALEAMLGDLPRA